MSRCDKSNGHCAQVQLGRVACSQGVFVDTRPSAQRLAGLLADLVCDVGWLLRLMRVAGPLVHLHHTSDTLSRTGHQPGVCALLRLTAASLHHLQSPPGMHHNAWLWERNRNMLPSMHCGMPALALRWWKRRFPRRPRVSMPFTAFSMMRSGIRCRQRGKDIARQDMVNIWLVARSPQGPAAHSPTMFVPAAADGRSASIYSSSGSSASKSRACACFASEARKQVETLKTAPGGLWCQLQCDLQYSMHKFDDPTHRLQVLEALDLHRAGPSGGVPSVQLVVELVARHHHLCRRPRHLNSRAKSLN